jgi:hypothetical protein
MLKRFGSFCIFILVFFNALAKEHAEENIIATNSFEPLMENEQFSYKMVGDNQRTLQLYARNKKFPEIYRFIDEWENVGEWGGLLQFSRDRKICFFLMTEKTSYNDALYKVDGRKGTVEYVRHVPYTYRTSLDGDLLVFENIDYDESNGKDVVLYDGKEPRFISYDRKATQFILYEIETRTVIGSFEMTVRRNELGGGFYIKRDETGKFKIIYSIEGGKIAAFAIIDPGLKELKMIWDNTDNLLAGLPYSRDEEWRDDIMNQWKDTFLRINH